MAVPVGPRGGGAVALLLMSLVVCRGADIVIDKPTGTTIVVPDGYAVTPNQQIPEWHLVVRAGTSAPPTGANKDVLCAVSFSGTPAVGGHTDPAYLKEEVDDHMRELGARDPASVFEPTKPRFLMVSEWNATMEDDAEDTIFMYHAESNKAYAYMSCVTRREAANMARPVFRAFWNGISLPN